MEIAALVILVFLSGFFSGTETALTSLGRVKIRALIEREGKRARGISFWANDPNRVLATILVGNNLVNIGASVLATLIATRFWGNGLSAKIAWSVTGVMTFIILTFGEVVPKTFARQNSEIISLKTIRFLRGLSYVFSPVIKLLLWISKGVLKLLGKKLESSAPFMTEEEMKILIGLGEEHGVIEEEEREMIEGIFQLGDTKVREIMVPVPEIVSIGENAELEEVLSLAGKAGFSRIPVYRGRVDNIAGLLYVKDLLLAPGTQKEGKVVVKDVMHQPYFVPETKKVNELLREFQFNKVHMAIVVDEYGMVAGLITMEDLIEEIVGEIEDEHDKTEEKKIEYLENGEVLVKASIDIGELNEKVGISLPDEENVETVAGFITDYLGRVPSVGETVDYGNLEIRVVEATRRRVNKVKICGLKGGAGDEQHEG